MHTPSMNLLKYDTLAFLPCREVAQAGIEGDRLLTAASPTKTTQIGVTDTNVT